jgi:hypothetical protein
VTNPEKEEFAILIDSAVKDAFERLNIRYSGTVEELVQRFAHEVVDHVELVPPTWQQCVERMCRG